MRSYENLAKRHMTRMNKKGQIVSAFGDNMLNLFVLVVIIVAILLGLSTLNPGNFFTAGSLARNNTVALQDNTTQIVGNFSQQLPTVGTIFGVVLILSAIGLLIFVVMRFKNAAGNSGGGL